MAAFNFPLVYQALIDGFSGTKKYIDGVNGSNSNNGDTVNTAYATIDYAITANTSATATMFVIAEGTYTMTAVSTGNSLAIRDGGNHREFVCQPGSVVIQWTANTADRDSPITQFTNTNSKIYGGILKRNNNGRTANYSVAYYKGQSLGNFYNCVFSETNANNAWSYQYDNYGQNNIAIRNCTFFNGAAPSGNYTNNGTCLTIDTVFNTTVITGGTETNVLKSQTVNATTYETTGVTTAGVYSGTYAWGQAVLGVSFQINGSDAIAANEGQTVTVVIVGSTETGTRNYTISGVSSADINGASLTGTVSLVNYEASFNITLTEDITSGEGIENLTVVMEDPTGNQQATLTVNDTSAVLYVTPTAVSGDTISVRLNTSNTPEVNGTQIPYTISGDYITASNIGQPLTGNFTVNNNIAELIINLGAIVSTTLTVTAYGETASCTITFISDLNYDVVTQISQPTYQSAMIASLLDGVTAPISYGIPIGSQVDDAKTIAIPKPDLIEVEPFITVTTSDNGKLNNFVNLPLGAEIIKEYWI